MKTDKGIYSHRTENMKNRPITKESLSEENQRLRRENKILKQEREILKKATVYFAKETL